MKAGICKHLQWNLRITDTLGTGLLSFVERLSLSRRLALSKLAPSPSYVSIASSPGFPVWVGLSFCKARRALVLLCWNGKHSMAMAIMYKCASHCGSVCSRRLFYIQLRSFPSQRVSVLQSREVVRISEVRNTLDVCNRCFLICPFYRGCPHLGGSVKRDSTVHYISCRTGYKHLHSKHVIELLNTEPYSDCDLNLAHYSTVHTQCRQRSCHIFLLSFFLSCDMPSTMM